jgi:hypothetical protein
MAGAPGDSSLDDAHPESTMQAAATAAAMLRGANEFMRTVYLLNTGSSDGLRFGTIFLEIPTPRFKCK